MVPALRIYGNGWDSIPPTLWMCLDTYQWVQFFVPIKKKKNSVGWCRNVLCGMLFILEFSCFSFRRMRTTSSPSSPSPNRKDTDAAIPTRLTLTRWPERRESLLLTLEMEERQVFIFRNGSILFSPKMYFTLAATFITCMTTDGRSHGPSNEGFTTLANWKSRICHRPRLDRYCEAIGESWFDLNWYFGNALQ